MFGVGVGVGVGDAGGVGGCVVILARRRNLPGTAVVRRRKASIAVATAARAVTRSKTFALTRGLLLKHTHTTSAARLMLVSVP